MSWLYAPDSWTGFASAREAAARLAAHWRGPALALHPLSDGGLGCGEVLAHALGLQTTLLPGSGGDGERRALRAWPLDGAVFFESAEAVGLHTCPAPQAPLAATSFGLGGALRGLAQRYDGPLIVGLGGSGTMDGGLGLAQGLGLTALDADGVAIPPGAGAGALKDVRRLVGPAPLSGRVVSAWSDVRAPLADSAARFGPQKGATPSDVDEVERGLARWVGVVNAWRASHGRPPSDPSAWGSGAAGGLGFALKALLDAHLSPGAPHVARLTRLDAALRGRQGVILGEGRLDPSSFDGKVAGEVIQRARAAGVSTVIALCGQREGALPAAPEGPDLIVCCEELPGADREQRYIEAVRRVAAAAALG